MEVPRLGVELELQLLVYTTATATWDLSHVCNLHHSSRQHRILNPLSKARDRTRNLMVPSQIRFHGSTMGTPTTLFLGVILMPHGDLSFSPSLSFPLSLFLSGLWYLIISPLEC